MRWCCWCAGATDALVLLMRWCCWCCWWCWCTDAADPMMLLIQWCCWCSWCADAADDTVFHNFGALQWQMFSDISCTVHTPKKAILKPEAILEKGDHEGGCDYGPSQTATIWLSITHHHLPLNCCRFSGIQSQKLDISQFILILCSRFVRSSVFGLALDKSLVVFFLFPWSPF